MKSLDIFVSGESSELQRQGSARLWTSRLFVFLISTYGKNIYISFGGLQGYTFSSFHYLSPPLVLTSVYTDTHSFHA